MEHKLLINGVELQFSIFDAEFMGRFQNNLTLIKEKTARCEQIEDAHGIIVNQCKAIFEFFEGLFGYEKTRQLFGDSMDLMYYVKCFEMFVNNVDEQLIKLEAADAKYAPIHNA